MRTSLISKLTVLRPVLPARRARLLTELKFALCIAGALGVLGLFLAVLLP